MACLLAVHISDGVLVSWFWIGCTAVAFVWLAATSRMLTETEVPKLGLMTAALFVASQLHLPVGVMSVHLLLNGLAGILLSSRAILAIGLAVLLQAILFAHGGLSTWGINTLTMSLPAVAAGLIYHRWRWHIRRLSAIGPFLLGATTAAATVALSAGSIFAFGIDSPIVLATLLTLNTPLILLEGFITAAVLAYLGRVCPEWIKAPRASIPPTILPTGQIQGG